MGRQWQGLWKPGWSVVALFSLTAELGTGAMVCLTAAAAVVHWRGLVWRRSLAVAFFVASYPTLRLRLERRFCFVRAMTDGGTTMKAT